VYNERKNAYFKTVDSTPFFDKLKLDTLLNANRLRHDTFIHPDTLYKALNLNEKRNIFESALAIARTQKANISSSKDDLKARENWIVKHKIEFHLKFTLAFACLILFFIGAPLGAIIRKGGMGMPVVVSVLFFIFYYILSLMGEKFAKEMIVPAWTGIWLSSMILFPIGLFLTYKAATDSAIFNIDAYYEPIQKGFNKIFKRKKTV
jgi:lipopolysaccharide export system permease protein